MLFYVKLMIGIHDVVKRLVVWYQPEDFQNKSSFWNSFEMV